MASAPPTASAPGLQGALPQLPALDNTFGALLIGTFIGLMYVFPPTRIAGMLISFQAVWLDGPPVLQLLPHVPEGYVVAQRLSTSTSILPVANF